MLRVHDAFSGKFCRFALESTILVFYSVVNNLQPLSDVLSDWFDWLESLDSGHICLGLERVQAVYQCLGQPKLAQKVVVIGGTNGKGSTVALIEKIAQLNGYQTGAYTSPHLRQFHERIRIAAQPVQDADLLDAFGQVYQAKRDIKLTYFEFTTLAAFIIFAKRALDLVILEVGLGGRLDAVNIIDADCAVVTSVGLDHQDWLGSTSEEIGFEKAGIFRANTPAIYGQVEIPHSVLVHAESIGAQLQHFGQDYGIKYIDSDSQTWSWYALKNGQELQIKNLPKPHLGIENAATALAALTALELQLKPDKIESGLLQAYAAGRFEKIQSASSVTMILDVAHNPDGVDFLINRLQEDNVIESSIHAVVAIMQDKDWKTILQKLLPWVDHWYLPELIVGSRFSPAADMMEYLRSNMVSSVVKYPEIETALKKAYDNCSVDGVVLVMGSFFTVSQACQTRFFKTMFNETN